MSKKITKLATASIKAQDITAVTFAPHFSAANRKQS